MRVLAIDFLLKPRFSDLNICYLAAQLEMEFIEKEMSFI